MAKKVKRITAAEVTALVAAADVQVVAAAKLTRRNATPSAAVLEVAEGGVRRALSGHNADAWAAVSGACPAGAAELAALPIFKDHAKLRGGVWVSYALRRGWLRLQAN